MKYPYFDGQTFSELFADDMQDKKHVFMLAYPCTAAWSPYPNTKKYFIQDGNEEAKKVGFDKIRQKEPWKNMAVLGKGISGILTDQPSDELFGYWQNHFDYGFDNIIELSKERYLDEINESPEFEKVITLFPFDDLHFDKHAVHPDKHYNLLSKNVLNQINVQVPYYEIFEFAKVRPEDVELRSEYPYVIKTSHGLSGEGTYIINNEDDLNFCRKEVRAYLGLNLVDAVVVSEFVKNVVQNYCVQFYVGKTGAVKIAGATNQIVSAKGEHLGGLIHYEADVQKFFPLIENIAHYLHQNEYFGMVGFDVLEDKDGGLHVIDVNPRVNGSTPLCLQRKSLLSLGKETAKYSTDYVYEGNLKTFLQDFKTDLERKDFTILSALEQNGMTEIYGIVAGSDFEEMMAFEKAFTKRGLRILG